MSTPHLSIFIGMFNSFEMRTIRRAAMLLGTTVLLLEISMTRLLVIAIERLAYLTALPTNESVLPRLTSFDTSSTCWPMISTKH